MQALQQSRIQNNCKQIQKEKLIGYAQQKLSQHFHLQNQDNVDYKNIHDYINSIVKTLPSPQNVDDIQTSIELMKSISDNQERAIQMNMWKDQQQRDKPDQIIDKDIQQYYQEQEISTDILNQQLNNQYNDIQESTQCNQKQTNSEANLYKDFFESMDDHYISMNNTVPNNNNQDYLDNYIQQVLN